MGACSITCPTVEFLWRCRLVNQSSSSSCGCSLKIHSFTQGALRAGLGFTPGLGSTAGLGAADTPALGSDYGAETPYIGGSGLGLGATPSLQPGMPQEPATQVTCTAWPVQDGCMACEVASARRGCSAENA